MWAYTEKPKYLEHPYFKFYTNQCSMLSKKLNSAAFQFHCKNSLILSFTTAGCWSNEMVHDHYVSGVITICRRQHTNKWGCIISD